MQCIIYLLSANGTGNPKADTDRRREVEFRPDQFIETSGDLRLGLDGPDRHSPWRWRVVQEAGPRAGFKERTRGAGLDGQRLESRAETAV